MKNECMTCGVTSLPVYSWEHGDSYCGACLVSRTAKLEPDATRYRFMRDVLAVQSAELAAFVKAESIDSSAAEAIDDCIDAKILSMTETVESD